MIARLAAFFRTRALHKAATAYARDLGPQLARDYGAAEFYTVPQIAATATRAGLPTRYLALGFARYLPEADYQAQPYGQLALSRADARAMLDRFRPSLPSPAFQPAGENSDANASVMAP